MSTSSIPIIGITAYRAPAAWGDRMDVDTHLLATRYANAVLRAGGAPVLLPPFPDEDVADAVLDGVSGLVLTGGPDVNPARYGQEPGAHTVAWSDERDASEIWLAHAASRRGLPVLGICRGMQLMAVAGGGSLDQHLPDITGKSDHEVGGTYAPVTVHVEPGHRISALEPATFVTHCHHHQTVHDHPGFTATARDDDGILHAMEEPGDRFAVGVQWHPETTDDPALFDGLVAAATTYRESSGRD